MLATLQVVTLLLVAVTMALALAHALEFPGKLRLDKETYLKVQAIYYPGFTVGGSAEFLALIALAALAIFTPTGTPAFWLTVGSLLAIAAVQAIYWLVTHPVNSVWLKDTKLGGAGSTFFDAGGKQGGEAVDWTALRDRWEYSHVARAVFGALGLALLSAAVVI